VSLGQFEFGGGRRIALAQPDVRIEAFCMCRLPVDAHLWRSGVIGLAQMADFI